MRSRRDAAIAIAVCAQAEKIDLCGVARLLGWHSARLASPLEVLAYLGSEQETVSPLANDGHPVLIDVALWEVERVRVSGGTHDLYVELSIPDLVRLTGGSFARVALPRSRWE